MKTEAKAADCRASGQRPSPCARRRAAICTAVAAGWTPRHASRPRRRRSRPPHAATLSNNNVKQHHNNVITKLNSVVFPRVTALSGHFPFCFPPFFPRRPLLLPSPPFSLPRSLGPSGKRGRRSHQRARSVKRASRTLFSLFLFTFTFFFPFFLLSSSFPFTLAPLRHGDDDGRGVPADAAVRGAAAGEGAQVEAAAEQALCREAQVWLC